MVGIEKFAGVALRSLEQVGHYAFRITFTDGHSSGIFPFTRLRALGFAEGAAPAPVPSATDPFAV